MPQAPLRNWIVLVLLLGAVGCGGSQEDVDGPTISVVNGHVHIWCFGGDCDTAVIQDSGAVFVGATRTIAGVAETRIELVPHVTDVEVDMGGGRDSFQMVDIVIPGTLRVATGAGDDVIDLCDGGARGDTRISTDDGNDDVSFDPVVYASRFRLDLGSGDDTTSVEGAFFPNGATLLGGDGTDNLYAPAAVLEHAQRIEDFEAIIS